MQIIKDTANNLNIDTCIPASNTNCSDTKKKVDFANSVDRNEPIHYEPPHLDLECLPSSLLNPKT